MCECEEVHAEAILSSQREMPDEQTLYDLSDFFKVFADYTRVRILLALSATPLCVCDLASELGMTKSAVSHQLKLLRQSTLVTYRKAGKNVFYTLADDHVGTIIRIALEHIREGAAPENA